MKRTATIIILIAVGFAAGCIVGYTIRGTGVTAPSAQTSTDTQTTQASTEFTSTDLTAKIAAPDGGAAAGNRFYTLTLTNQSKASCTVNGYPGVSFVDSTKAQIGQPADKDTSVTASSISLATNASATATIKLASSGAYPDGTCKDGATTLKVIPPNDTGYLLVPTDSVSITTWCPGFTVTELAKS